MYTSAAEIIVVTYGCLLVTGVVREHVGFRHVSSPDPVPWEKIVRGLRCVRTTELRRLASSAESDVPPQAHTGSDMLEDIGGLEGVRRLQHNGIVLAALARRIEEFVVLDDPGVVETIEKSALQLRRKALSILAMKRLGCGKRIIRLYLRDMATLYCRMVSQLMELYAVTHRSRVQRLIEACNW